MNFSQLDGRVQISNDLWAITLIKEPRSNHAIIAIEGENNNGLFSKLAHLTGPGYSNCENTTRHGCCYFFAKKGQVKIINLKGKKIRYGKKTQTWQVASVKVERMLEQIEREESLFTADDQNLTPFSIFGKKSIFTRKITYYEIHNKELEELRKKDLILFKSIYQESIDPEFYTHLGMKISLGFPIPILNLIVGSIYAQICHKYFTFSYEKRKTLVELAKTSIREHKLNPQNCFTWARDKISSVGIEIPSKTIDIFIAATSLYTV